MIGFIIFGMVGSAVLILAGAAIGGAIVGIFKGIWKAGQDSIDDSGRQKFDDFSEDGESTLDFIFLLLKTFIVSFVISALMLWIFSAIKHLFYLI